MLGVITAATQETGATADGALTVEARLSTRQPSPGNLSASPHSLGKRSTSQLARRNWKLSTELAATVVEQTEEPPTHLLLYLNNQTFAGDIGRLLAAQVRRLLAATNHDHGLSGTDHVKILLVHELDADNGGCEFSCFFDTTPRDLVVDGVYRNLATGLAPGMHRATSLALIAKSMGAKKQGNRKGGGSVMQAFEADQKTLERAATRKKSLALAAVTAMVNSKAKGSNPFLSRRKSEDAAASVASDKKSEESETSASAV